MFDLGFQELIVIFSIALLVFGPKKLPEIARQLGRGMQYLKRSMGELKSEVDKEIISMEALEAAKKDTGKVRDELRSAARELAEKTGAPFDENDRPPRLDDSGKEEGPKAEPEEEPAASEEEPSRETRPYDNRAEDGPGPEDTPAGDEETPGKGPQKQ